MCKQQVCTISSQYLNFWPCNGPKASKGNEVTFLKLDFLNFYVSYGKANEIFDSTGKKLDKIGMASK